MEATPIIEALSQIGYRSLATLDPKPMERRPKPTPLKFIPR